METGRVIRWTCAAGIVALLAGFVIVAYSAVLGKSATYDEPLHAVAGFVRRTTGDFRLDPEDPALFGYWAAIPHSSNALQIDMNSRNWSGIVYNTSMYQWPWVVDTLYRTRGNDPIEFINRSRFMFVLLGAGLGAVVAMWAWQLAGPIAGLLAASMLTLDANFLAHSPLVKNDVPLALLMTLLAWSLWRLGRGGWSMIIVAALATAAAVTVKFSGVLCAPIALILLTIRALESRSWRVAGMALAKRWQRLVATVAILLFIGVVSYAGIWACYRFRYEPVTSGRSFDIDEIVLRAKRTRLMVRTGIWDAAPAREMVEAEPAGLLVNTLSWATEKHALPQAWAYGFLYTYATTLLRSCYLMGAERLTGWWYYFPCCFAFKTPTATLGSIAICLVLGAIGLVKWIGKRAESVGTISLWDRGCIGVPLIVYAATAMATNLNLGLRHLLPIYPFIFVAVAVSLAGLIQRWPRVGGIIAAIIVLGLGGESLARYPDFIPFFNLPSGGPTNGIKLLGDSNLDWGQDLPALAAWSTEHRDRPLYLSYFGIVDPGACGIPAINVPADAGGWPFDTHPALPVGRCYFAISATNLQGIYVSNTADRMAYQRLLQHTPVAVLGHSVYVYELPIN